MTVIIIISFIIKIMELHLDISSFFDVTLLLLVVLSGNKWLKESL